MKTLRVPCAFLLLGACAEPVPVPEPDLSLERPQAVATRTTPARPFVRVERAQARAGASPVRVHLQEATLTECLSGADPALNLVPTTSGIDLSRRYTVRVNALSLAQYLDILEGITGYALEMDPDHPIIYVSSYISRSWDVSTFAGHGQSRFRVGDAAALGTRSRSGGEEDSEDDKPDDSGNASVIYDHSDTPWETLLENARTILQVGAEDAPSEKESGAARTWLVADRRLGLLRARGPAARIRELDQWLDEQIRQGARQVLLAVAILDVSREQGAAKGLDLELLYRDMDERASIMRRGIPSALPTSLNGAWEVDAALEFGRWSLEAMVQQLSGSGKVTVRSDPVFTVVNGMTSFLGDGEELSYIAGTDLVLGENNASNVLAAEFEHIRVGFRIAVTPRVRQDGSILVEVVPVLSSIRSLTEFDTGVSSIVRPNIAIQELATLAITRSGKPILLGGLIQSRFREDQTDPLCEHFLCNMFATSRIEHSNRELMIVITPIEVAI